MNIPNDVLTILHSLADAGYEAYAVGGCVRDSLMGRTPHDWDICTSAMPEEIAQVFRGRRTIETGLKHGTLTVLLRGEPYEITTYRTDGVYSDHRRPDNVTFVRELSQDLARRDFTVNAMAADENELVDLYGGRDDLARQVIRCVGDARERFEEDALRILRAARFASSLDFTIESATREAMDEKLPTLDNVSRERVYTELKKLLSGSGAARVAEECYPVLLNVLPEARAREDMSLLSRLPQDDILRLAFLLRPAGEDAAKRAMLRLKCDRDSLARVTIAAREKEGTVPADLPAMLRLLNRAGEAGARDVIALERALGTPGADQAAELLCRALPLAWRVSDLAVDGGDLRGIGIAPGKAIGDMLRTLLDRVMDGTVPNTKEALLACAKCQSDDSRDGSSCHLFG